MLWRVAQTKPSPLAVLIVGLAAGISLGLAGGVFADKPAASAAKTELPWQDARLFAEVVERVKLEYVDPVDDHELLQAAIRGMVSSLDPHSAFLDGEEYDELKISTAGEYSGVGIEVSLEDDSVAVVSAIPGTPAAAAGIRSGDVIASIDGIAVNSASLEDAITRMRGKEGTLVKIGVLREGIADPLEFALRRTRVELHSVKAVLAQAGFGYVQISQFSETTGAELRRALQGLVKQNAGPLKGLVLDLRDNPGGVLEAAVAVGDAFLDKGIIVTATGRTPESNFEMDATPGDDLNGAPMVVLVNGGSASAAEIVAGALKDHHRATLMGRKTYGKGSVQTVVPLSDARAIKLTTSRYFTPSGASIDHKGIMPDILLERNSQAKITSVPADIPLLERDPEIRRAFSELNHPTLRRAAATAAAG
jgi:carboxyl-terminal processing protease